MADIREYLRESNAIEDVHDEQALETAYEAWEELRAVDTLTKENIKSVHGTLLKNRQPEIAGEFRDCNVRVGGDVPPSPNAVPELVSELLSTTPETPFEALDWHIRFEKIHPFADGNGRIGRLIYLWHCYSHLNHDPIMWRADDRHGYYALFDTDDISPRVCE
jgi:Fic family protein